ncbi:MAG: hypothetical protein LBL66_06990 [Clostridiales bacterium]|jgi:hypothetical protein|nr:hypothetical protein [Clostridiales bacterium]
MANVISAKKIKIKPENEAVAEGTVVKCKYAGNSRVGIGPFAKATHYYKIFIEVQGLDKPLVLKVKEKDGWNADVLHAAKAIGKMFGGDKPVNEGEKITVVYDKSKPKKCNIAE